MIGPAPQPRRDRGARPNSRPRPRLRPGRGGDVRAHGWAVPLGCPSWAGPLRRPRAAGPRAMARAAGPRAAGLGTLARALSRPWAAFAGPRALLLDQAEMAKQKYSHSFCFFLFSRKQFDQFELNFYDNFLYKIYPTMFFSVNSKVASGK